MDDLKLHDLTTFALLCPVEGRQLPKVTVITVPLTAVPSMLSEVDAIAPPDDVLVSETTEIGGGWLDERRILRVWKRRILKTQAQALLTTLSTKYCV
jgi:hypothetical protein